jgi:hypothetical protein
MTIIR